MHFANLFDQLLQSETIRNINLLKLSDKQQTPFIDLSRKITILRLKAQLMPHWKQLCLTPDHVLQ